MAPVKRVLFFTQSEYGQAQVHLAVAYELLSRPDVEVHLASFERLRSRTAEVSELHQRQDAGSKNKIHFHLIDFPSMKDLVALGNHKTTFSPLHPCGYSGALQSYRNCAPILFCWTPEQYLAIVRRCSELVDEIQPDMVGTDSLFYQALDMCRNRLAPKEGAVDGKVEYFTLTPIEFAASLADQQPRLGTWWKYPVISSGFSYPVPWYLIPINIFLRIRLIIIFISSSTLRNMAKARTAAHLSGMVPLFEVYRKDEFYISPCISELDYPMEIPSNVRGCGPITIPCAPVTESDPKLAQWLDKPSRRTVLINLGSHITSEGNDAIEIAKALRVVMAANPDIQVLWKLLSGVTAEIKAIIGPEIAADRIRIVEWLKADPVAILQTGHVACMVNHGGANSYFEAISERTPQVVLPVWYDTYGFANKVEWLGIGLWGSKKAAPGVEAAEFAKALSKVVGEGVERNSMLEKVRELAVLCKKAGGRKTAAYIVGDLLNKEKMF